MKSSSNKQNKTNKTRKGNGEGTLYFNETKKLWVFQQTMFDVSGKKYRKTFYGKTKQEARKKAQSFMLELSLGTAKNQKAVKSLMTICELIADAFEVEFQLNQFSEATYARKKSTLKIIQNHEIGNVPIQKIDDNLINNFFGRITSYSNSVISKIYSMLNYGLNIAVQNKIIFSNPLNNPYLKKPRSEKSDKKIGAFTIEEQGQFLKALEEYEEQKNRCYYKPQLLIALFTGMRMGEINALSPDDVNLENRKVYVHRTISSDIEYDPLLKETTKTKKGVREIPLNDNAVEAFRMALERFVPNRENLLFYDTYNDKVITTSQVNNAFKRICEKHNIKNGTNVHMLRHTFATRCIEAGIEATVLKEWLGHTDISVTLNIYNDVLKHNHDKSIDLLQKYTTENGLSIV